MLIFGFGSKNRVLGTIRYVCETCGNDAAHHVVKRSRRFTLFFVPVLPLGSKHSDTCVACGRVRDITADQARSAVGA